MYEQLQMQIKGYISLFGQHDLRVQIIRYIAMFERFYASHSQLPDAYNLNRYPELADAINGYSKAMDALNVKMDPDAPKQISGLGIGQVIGIVNGTLEEKINGYFSQMRPQSLDRVIKANNVTTLDQARAYINATDNKSNKLAVLNLLYGKIASELEGVINDPYADLFAVGSYANQIIELEEVYKELLWSSKTVHLVKPFFQTPMVSYTLELNAAA